MLILKNLWTVRVNCLSDTLYIFSEDEIFYFYIENMNAWSCAWLEAL